MSPAKRDPLREALEAAAGTGTPSSIDPRLLAWATTLRETRRGVLGSEPCPSSVLHRVQGIPAARIRGASSILLRLVFDSWRDLAPATRGARPPRTLRCEDRDRALDLRIVREDDGGVLVQVAAEPEQDGLRAVIDVGGDSAPVEGTLDPTGAGQLRVPASAEELVVTIREGDRALMRSPSIRLE